MCNCLGNKERKDLCICNHKSKLIFIDMKLCNKTRVTVREFVIS